MNKLKIPKKPFKGVKVYCKKCKVDCPKCSHYDSHCYRVRVHVPSTLKKVKTRVLNGRNYEDAVQQSIQFKKELEQNGYYHQEPLDTDYISKDNYLLLQAVADYNDYLNGRTDFSHLNKNLSKGYIDETIRYISLWCKVIKNENKDLSSFQIAQTNKRLVSAFYCYCESHYQAKTFNKCFGSLKAFFDFVIKIQKIQMDNPFEYYVAKPIIPNANDTLTQEEFMDILNAVEEINPLIKLGGKGETKNLYRPYLKDGFKLFLLTGGRREEVVNLRWSDIYITYQGILFFNITNLKVSRKTKSEVPKYIPIGNDLKCLLDELGYNEKKTSTEYILAPDRKVLTKTIMNDLSKAFTHFKNGAGIEKNVSLKNLRKTYITWVHRILEQDTGLITSHATKGVIEKYYIDPSILTKIEEAALNVKVFG